MDLQNELPNARVVYASATAATEVYNLAYADRLGLWGPGTPFPTVLNFVSQVEKGGIAAMEVVARDMKQMGLYMARTLSFEGVEYGKVEHELTSDQRRMYDAAARSWQRILSNIDRVVMEETNGGGRQRGAALAQFWGSHQRFFQQVLTAMQMPTVIAEIKRDLKAGQAPVVQIVNTNEAATNRAVGKLEEGDTLDDIDITPRDDLIQYLETSFPVHQYEEYTDDDGRTRTRPVQDSKGNYVVNAEAVRTRDELIGEMAAMTLPGNPLDLLIETFGADKVAEVTGRSTRIVTKGGRKRTERRTQNKALAEAAEFQAGKRDLLVFSDAGGTGMDFHADLSAKNQKRRAHYVLQAGWRADRAIQGFGRTHRTNQAQPPIYKLAGTNLSGHKRFTSSIARRLDQLGALTKGQSDTGGGGMFNATDNLENEYAENAVMALMREVYAGDIEGWSAAELESELGLKLEGEKGFNVSKVPPVPQFLNRLLNVSIDRQNSLFDRFVEHMEAGVQQAIERGEFTAGVEEVKHDGAQLQETQEIRRDAENAGVSEYRMVNLRRRTEITPFDDVARFSSVQWKRNRETGAVYGFRPASSRTNEQGQVVPTYHRHSPTDRTIVDSTDYRSNYEIIQADDAEAAWREQIDQAPEFREETMHMVTGALLPIWDRLPASSPRIVRLRLDDGRTLLGRAIPDVELTRTLENLGVSGPRIDMTPDQVMASIMEGRTVHFSSGHRVTRRKVGGEQRVEIIAPPARQYEDARPGGTFDRLGFQIERIDYKARAFAPDSADGRKALGQFMAGKSITNVVTGRDQVAEGVRRGFRREQRDYAAEWARGLAKVLTNRRETKDFVLTAGRPGAALHHYGKLSDDPVQVDGRRVHAFMEDHKKDGLRPEHLARVPELVDRPDFVLRSRNRDEAAIAAKWIDGQIFIAPISRNKGMGSLSHGAKKAHVILSVYPVGDRAGSREWLEREARAGRMLFDLKGDIAAMIGEERTRGMANRVVGSNVPPVRRRDTDVPRSPVGYIPTGRDLINRGNREFTDEAPLIAPIDWRKSPVFSALRKSLRALGLGDVEIQFDPFHSAQGSIEADFWGRMVITIGNTLNPRWTLGHEAVHAYRHMGVFTRAEWDTLADAAEAHWIEEFGIEERYPDLTRAEQVEEAVAEAFGQVYAGHRKGFFTSSRVFAALRKIANFLKAVQNWARGQGFQTPADIMHAMARGEFAPRAQVRRRPQGWKTQAARLLKQQRQQGAVAENGGRMHMPDRKVWDTLADENLTVFERVRKSPGAISDRLDSFRSKFQDRFLPMRRAQEAVEKALGHPLDEDLDAYGAEELFSGRAGFKLDRIDNEFTAPIIKIIGNTPGMTPETVGRYLYARHAAERNARIAEINEDLPDGGSGMADDEAAAILAEIEASDAASGYKEIGKLIDRLREWSINERIEHGLMTEFEARAWAGAYQHYVPLKGWAETDGTDAELDISGIGRGYNVRGDETRRALGRQSEAFNPLVAAITQAQEVAVRSEKNRVGQHLYRLAKDLPSKDLWSVKRTETRRVFNETTGLVEERSFSPITLIQSANEFAVKVNGEEHRVILHDPRLVRAMSQVGSDSMITPIRLLSHFSRYFSAINTMLNPVFLPKNVMRDAMTATLNVRRFKNGAQIQRKMLRYWAKALAGSYRGLGGKEDTAWAQYFQEFSEAGGKVSFWVIENPESGFKDIERRVKIEGGGKLGLARGLVTPSLSLNPALKWVERVNLAGDNAMRLAAFVAARENGYTVAEAASLSKNLTVNFNRRGEWGSIINAAYTFSNAGFQGTHMILKSLKDSAYVRRAAIGLILAGYLLEHANAYLSDEDEDGELYYDKIPDYTHAMNAVLMLGRWSGRRWDRRKGSCSRRRFCRC